MENNYLKGYLQKRKTLISWTNSHLILDDKLSMSRHILKNIYEEDINQEYYTFEYFTVLLKKLSETVFLTDLIVHGCGLNKSIEIYEHNYISEKNSNRIKTCFLHRHKLEQEV